MRYISVDLEVGTRDGRIYAFAAVDGTTSALRTFPKACLGEIGLSAALAQLDDFAEDGNRLVGHNLIDFDIRHLEAVAPELRLLGMPVLDTLRLSPLALPANPYHHLIKHYQDGDLVRRSIIPNWTRA